MTERQATESSAASQSISPPRRVVITGMGVVNAIGETIEEMGVKL